MSEFRKFVIPKDGNIFLEFDFKQLEVNGLAEITACKKLIAELNSGVDVHRRNAAAWKKIEEHEVDEDTRTKAKVMTFQMQYGASVSSMSESLGILKEEVSEFLSAFYKKYPEIENFHYMLSSNCRQFAGRGVDNGLMWLGQNITPTHRRYIVAPRERDDGSWYYSSTEAKNYPVQGFATGDLVPIVLNSMVDSYPKLLDLIVTTVHDSALFDVSYDELFVSLYHIEKSFADLPAIFKNLFDFELKVYYDYDISIGGNWKELKDKENQYSRSDVVKILKGEGLIGEDYECYRNYY